MTKYDNLKRAYEHAYPDGADLAAATYALAQAIAASVINTCIDPRRKDTRARTRPDDSGHARALEGLKRGIYADRDLLDHTARAADELIGPRYGRDGDISTGGGSEGLDDLIARTLSDGIDLVQVAACELLAQAAEHAIPGAQWLDVPYTIRRRSKRARAGGETAIYREVITTPMQEAYRAVRREIEAQRAVQEVRGRYIPLEAGADDEDLTTIDRAYYDMGLYSGLDGSSISSEAGDTGLDYDCMISDLRLSDHQLIILLYRMQGVGLNDIAARLGTSKQAVYNSLQKIRKKAEKLGYKP